MSDHLAYYCGILVLRHHERSLKLVSEEGEVAEAHSLATLKTDSRLNGNAALSFGYLTEEDEYVLMVKQDDGGYRRIACS